MSWHRARLWKRYCGVKWSAAARDPPIVRCNVVQYTREELEEAKRALESTLHKCERIDEKKTLAKSQQTLLTRRIAALGIALQLIDEKLVETE